MAWPLAILLIFGCLVALMITGMPIFIAFMLTCIVGALLFWGGMAGMDTLLTSVFSSVTSFVFLPVPLFVLMGNIIFESGVGTNVVDAVDKVLGRLPGRLSILAIGAGVLLGTMIGISGGSIAVLGKSLVPEMSRRGYKKPMTLGPIVASGTLAVLIPPSALAVIIGALGKVSIGKLLIAIIPPGLLVAVLFCAYIIIRCKLQPDLAPSYTLARVPVLEKISVTARYILPVGIVIFAAIGVIFLGIATPTEAAALGAIACYILAALYRKLNWRMIKESAKSTIQISVMVLMIMTASLSFSRVLVSSGAIAGLVKLSTELIVPSAVIVIATQLVVVFLGCFMDPASIVMISVPIFFPIVQALHYDMLWYALLLLVNIQLGLITPPFGLDVYTMKALSPADVTLGDVFRSSMPFLAIGFLLMVIIWVYPPLVLWLPSVVR
jgi:tripartite ATP-independent transporter DctM subunit